MRERRANTKTGMCYVRTKDSQRPTEAPVATHGKDCTVELVSLQRRPLCDYVNFMNFSFWIKCHFNVGI